MIFCHPELCVVDKNRIIMCYRKVKISSIYLFSTTTDTKKKWQQKLDKRKKKTPKKILKITYDKKHVHINGNDSSQNITEKNCKLTKKRA